MNTQEKVRELSHLISASRDETQRLQRQLVKIQEECPHHNIDRVVEEQLYLKEEVKTSQDTCRDCGMVLFRVVERTTKKGTCPFLDSADLVIGGTIYRAGKEGPLP